jgi:uncharacterized protein YaeQ
MAHWINAFSIADLASEWTKETGEARLEIALVSGIANGTLKVVDPEMEVLMGFPPELWNEAERRYFLEKQKYREDKKYYQEIFFTSGKSSIFKINYWYALLDMDQYGKAVTVEPELAEMTLSNLFIEKNDFRKWLEYTDRKFPAFWFSESERGLGIEVSLGVPKEKTLRGRAHVSDRLALLNQAAARFWANADREDRSTHTDNATIVAWLIERGYSETLAEKAATIIRPEWVPAGRKPS